MLRESAQAFLQQSAGVPLVRKLRDQSSTIGYSEELWTQMAEMGWPAVLIPEQYEGLGFGLAGMGQIMEQAGRTLASSPLFASAVVGASLIEQCGSESQKNQHLQAIAEGRLKLSLAVDEGAHHAPARIRTRAESVDGGYQIQGSKAYVIDGGFADLMIVAARTSGADEDTNGISLFLIEPDSEGVEIETTVMVDGRNSAQVRFNQAAVSADAMLGTDGHGYAALMNTLDRANALLAAELLGIAVECFERTNQYLKERKQFGLLIGAFQALQHRAAHLWSEIELGKSVVLHALQALDAGHENGSKLASAAKAKLCEIAELATNEAIQMHGGIGMTDEFDIGFFIKRARAAQMLYGDYHYHADRFASLNGY